MYKINDTSMCWLNTLACIPCRTHNEPQIVTWVHMSPSYKRVVLHIHIEPTGKKRLGGSW